MRAEQCEVIAANKVVSGFHHECGYADVVPRFRVLGNEDVIDREPELPDLVPSRGTGHEFELLGDEFVVVHVGVVAEPNGQFIFRRHLVNVAHDVGR
jgi:hypothetical protein